MKFLLIECFVILSISIVSTTASNLTDGVVSTVSSFQSDLQNFIINGINSGCALFANIYRTYTDVIDMINSFVNGIKDKLSEIRAALPSQVSQILGVICGLLSYLLNPNYITSVIDQFVTLANGLVNFLSNLIGQPDTIIHQAFCGNAPGTVWNYFEYWYTTFIGNVTNLSSLLSNLVCGP